MILFLIFSKNIIITIIFLIFLNTICFWIYIDFKFYIRDSDILILFLLYFQIQIKLKLPYRSQKFVLAFVEA